MQIPTGDIQFGCGESKYGLSHAPEETKVCHTEPKPDTLEWIRGLWNWGLCLDDKALKHEDFLKASADDCPCVAKDECTWAKHVLGLRTQFPNTDVVKKINDFFRERRCLPLGSGVRCCDTDLQSKIDLYEESKQSIFECTTNDRCKSRAIVPLLPDSPCEDNTIPCHRTDIVPPSKASRRRTQSGRWIPSADKEECGNKLSFTNIHEGENARLGAYPYQALLGYRSKTNSDAIEYKCGGSVINGRYILTAAHCLYTGFFDFPQFEYQEPVEIVLGDHTIRSDPDCDSSGSNCLTAIRRQPEKVIVHPKYDKRYIQDGYDIALIRLNELIPHESLTGDGPATPVCLPWKETDPGHDLREGQLMTVTGWGRTGDITQEFNSETVSVPSDILQQLKVPYVDDNTCKGQLEEQLEGQLDLNGFNTTLMLCAGGVAGKGACGGDSGGPLAVKKRPDLPWFQVGVVSWNAGQCGTNLGSVYTRVTTFLDWIEDNLES